MASEIEKSGNTLLDMGMPYSIYTIGDMPTAQVEDDTHGIKDYVRNGAPVFRRYVYDTFFNRLKGRQDGVDEMVGGLAQSIISDMKSDKVKKGLNIKGVIVDIGYENEVFSLMMDTRRSYKNFLPRYRFIMDDNGKERGTERRSEALAKEVRRRIIDLVHTRVEDKEVLVYDRLYGIGGIGSAFSCRYENKDVAVKITNRGQINNNLNDPDFLSAVQEHENLMRFYGSYLVIDQDGKYRRMDIMEEFTDLHNIYRLFPEIYNKDKRSGFNRKVFIKYLSDYMMPLLKGLGALHRAGFVHGDLKPMNTGVVSQVTDEGDTENRVVILDYDLVSKAGTKEKNVIKGTPGYISYEQFYHEHEITQASDINALGMMLFEAGGGKLCRDIEGHMRMLEELPDKCEELDLPKALKNIIRRCTDIDPEKRPNAYKMALMVDKYVKDCDSPVPSVHFYTQGNKCGEKKA